MRITVGESNLFDEMNQLPTADGWRIPSDSLNPNSECPVAEPFGSAIFRDYFDGSNYTAGKALSLYDPSITYACSSQNYQSLVLLPLGNTSATISANGYWSTSSGASTTEAAFQRFPAGSYTVAAADEWGQVVLLHFRVLLNVGTNSSMHQVTFHQEGICGPPGPYYTAPWSVTLGNETKVEPTNARIPTPDHGFSAGPGYVNFATIIFSLPNGTYSYSVSPAGAFEERASGMVTVNGSDVTVQVMGPVMASCGPQFPQLVSLTISNPETVIAGSTVNLTALITGVRGPPNGTISWSDGGGGSGTFSSSTCILYPTTYESSACIVTYHTTRSPQPNGFEIFITASYPGDSNYPSVSAKILFILQLLRLPTLGINTENASGQTIYGYEVILSNVDGSNASVQFSSATFALNTGQTYNVKVADYGSCHFAHWADTGSTSASRPISITNDTLLVAVYNCGT